MKRKVKIILNPMADMRNAWRVASDLRPLINEYGGADWSGTVFPTHATQLALEAGESGYDMVIAMGGDGTVHEVINGLMQVPAERRPILGVVPVGSGNDFAHAIGVPMEADNALRQALNGEPSAVDIGLMTDEHGRTEYFDNTLGIGFDAVVTIRSHKLPLLRGFLMYLTAVIQTILLNFDPMDMKMDIDGKVMEQNNMMLALCIGRREGGGFVVAPDAEIDDGLMDYIMIRDVSRPMMFRLLPEFMRGTQGRFAPVTIGTCLRMEVTSDRPMYVHADGEVYSGFGSNLRKLSFEILPGGLKVVRG